MVSSRSLQKVVFESVESLFDNNDNNNYHCHSACFALQNLAIRGTDELAHRQQLIMKKHTLT